MKVKSIALIGLALLVQLTVAGQRAHAEGRGARFDFAPNVWKVEEARVPTAHVDPQHTVRNGAVPKATTLIGGLPQMLAQPTMPVVAVPTTSARVFNTQAVPRSTMTRPNFNPNFGNPLKATPLASQTPMAHPPFPPAASGMRVTGKKFPHHISRPMSAKPTALAHSRHGVSKNLSGVLKTRPQSANPAQVAASKPIATYGNNMGYVPGTYLPAVNSDGNGTRSSVHGRLIRR